MKRATLLTLAGVAVLVLAGAVLGNVLLNSKASDWAYKITHIRDLQDDGLTGEGVRVAVIDTGVDLTNPSLRHIKPLAWRDFVQGRPAPYDDQGHGSHVAGILAGEGGTVSGKVQGFNVKGAAPDVGLIAIKVIAEDGSGTEAHVASGIQFAVQNGADIICLSLGAHQRPLDFLGDQISPAIEAAANRGILVVAAAGNTGEDDGVDDVERPANHPDVLAVGAIDRDRRVAAFSAEGNEVENYGTQIGPLRTQPTRPDPDKKPELVAPGVDILSAWKGQEYGRARGTSQAVPFVCGALALVLQAKPALRSDDSRSNVDRVKRAVMDSCEPLPGQRMPHDPEAGYGLLRADRLLREF